LSIFEFNFARQNYRRGEPAYMKRILHCADLHLTHETGESDYSFRVLEEIVSLAQRENVDFLIFCGDTFDTFKSAEVLCERFRKTLKRLYNLKEGLFTILLAGNHEMLDSRDRTLSSMDFGVSALAEASSFKFKLFSFPDKELEFLAIPHRSNYSDYLEWIVPEKKSRFRLAVAHGSIAGLGVPVFDEEERGSVMDTDLFRRLSIDYALLGHIHTHFLGECDGVLLTYPGSARVWRKGEIGPRYVNIIEVCEEIKLKKVGLPSAGEYRFYRLPLTLEGNLSPTEELAESWGVNDFIHISLTGVVENQSSISSLERELRKSYEDKVRRLEIEREDIISREGISKHPLAVKFLQLWKEAEPEPEDGEAFKAWLRARSLGLKKIKERIESGR